MGEKIAPVDWSEITIPNYKGKTTKYVSMATYN